MIFASYCKDCSCWCVFSVSAIIMLIMFSLALKDMTLIAGQQALVQQIMNTPTPQLSCTQICESWYSKESEFLCCDRYNMHLCVAKEKCKMDYIKSSEIAVQILQNDQFHQIVVMVVCGLILVIIAFRNRQQLANKKVQEQLDAKIRQMMKQMVHQMQKQMRNENIIVLGQQAMQNPRSQKNFSVSTAEDNSSEVVGNFMNESIVCAHLQHFKSHPCSCYSELNSR